MQMYNALVEVKAKPKITGDLVDELMEKLGGYHPSVSTSPRGWLAARISVPAESLGQATTTAAAVVSSAAAGAEAIACEVMTEAEFDAREGWVPVPDLVNVVDAAALLGITRQAVLDRIRRGKMQATKVGRDYAIPRGQLPPPELEASRAID